MNRETSDTIRSLVLHWSGTPDEGRSPAVQLRLQRLLSMVDWRPVGMKPSAILLVRRIHGLPPLPYDTVLPLSWENRLRDQLTALYLSAARPTQGDVPFDAESVLFENPADMLISLTRETLNAASVPPRNWYWRQIIGESGLYSSGAALASCWAREVAFLPAALSYLTLSEIYRAASMMTPHEAWSVLDALRAAFALPDIQMLSTSSHALPLFHQEATEHDTQNASEMSTPTKDPVEHARTSDDTPTTPSFTPSSDITDIPWTDWLPRLPDNLSPYAKVLLVWCDALRRIPVQARSRAFAEQIAAQFMTPKPSSPREAEKRHSVTAEDSTPSALTAQHPISTPIERDTSSIPPSDNIVFGGTMPLALDGMFTRLGGVLFLIHLLRWLDLPAQWSEQLGSWETLEAIARALLGDSGDDYADDPLWALLERLDGRKAGSPIGRDATLTETFRLPAIWLARFASGGRWQVFHESDRLIIVDADRGFLVLDVSLEGRTPDEAATSEIESYRAAGVECDWEWAAESFDSEKFRPSLAAALRQRISPSLGEWLGRTLTFFQWLIRASLQEPSLSSIQIAETLLCRSGTLTVSDTHIDLYFPMETADVRLRRVGFDYDPSWRPELGYIVLFHFVD